MVYKKYISSLSMVLLSVTYVESMIHQEVKINRLHINPCEREDEYRPLVLYKLIKYSQSRKWMHARLMTFRS